MTPEDLSTRAQGRCELCGATDDLGPFAVGPGENSPVLCCATCRGALEGSAGEVAAPAAGHWNCLRESAWSAVPAVQVLSWRLLHAQDAAWARELIDQIWMDEETLAWARQGLPTAGDAATLDAHGAALQDGDSVTLIKDLVVKGGNFTAKRGTLVKGIRLTDDPGLVEGRVNKVAIFLKTEFLKKVR